MSKRRHKTRTHVRHSQEDLKQIPKSLVIHVGNIINHSLNELVRDFRIIMQPHTAIKLKVRKSNKLKDFVMMCGPLGVTHLFIFTQSQKTGHVSLKIARAPKGPTLTFRVLEYSLVKDVRSVFKSPKLLGKEDVINPPLLILNGFNLKNEDQSKLDVEKLTVSMFQNMFPPLNPARTRLSAVRRVFMIDKDHETGNISLRHYAIDIKEVGISKNLKSLYKSKSHLSNRVPNLGNKKDIASLILDRDVGAYTSESEVEDEAIVSMIDTHEHQIRSKHTSFKRPVEDLVDGDDKDFEMKPVEEQSLAVDGDNEVPLEKRAIKLREIGPRLTLKLVKIEEDICNGKVLHHELVQKTDSEIMALEKKHIEKRKLKEKRRKEQEANLARKKAVKDEKKLRKLERRRARELAQKTEGSNNETFENSGSKSNYSSSSDDDDHSDIPEDLDSDLLSEIDV